MPAFAFEYVTIEGPRRESFTLDADRPLGVQVRRLLAELRQRDVVLLGGRDDQLSIEWNGSVLDDSLSPQVLGLTAHRPIELRMRPRIVAPLEVRVAKRSGSRRTSFVPLSVVSGCLLGGLAGAIGWTVLAILPVAVDSSQDRDALASILLLGGIGLLTAIAHYGWRRQLFAGLLAVVVGATVSASVGMALSSSSADANTPFLLQRLVLFVTIGTFGALTLALSSPTIGTPGSVLEASALGALAGLACGLLDSAESLGVASALAWPLFGALLGGVAPWPRLRRAYALCELLPPSVGLAAPFRMRSFALPRRGHVLLEDGAAVSARHGDVVWEAQAPITIDGQSATTAGATVNGDRVEIGSRVYRFREMP